jgi:hypothetical protein
MEGGCQLRKILPDHTGAEGIEARLPAYVFSGRFTLPATRRERMEARLPASVIR